MDSGIVKDFTGHEFAGFSDASVTATNSNTLLISSFLVVNGAMVKPDSFIGLVFDESVAPGNGDIILSNGFDTKTIIALAVMEFGIV